MVRVMTPMVPEDVDRLDGSMFHVNLEPVLEALRMLSRALGPDTALIGFCGAPWTVATYMIAGHGTPEQVAARLFAYRYPDAFARLLDVIADCSADYLGWQVAAGAEVVQIFEFVVGRIGRVLFRGFLREAGRPDGGEAA